MRVCQARLPVKVVKKGLGYALQSTVKPKQVVQKPKASASTSWVVQLGSFSEVKYAHQWTKKLYLAGYDVRQKQVTHQGKVMTKVWVHGPKSKQEAQALTQTLARQFGIQGHVKAIR